MNFRDSGFSVTSNMNINLTDAQIEDRISKGNLNFILHGLNNSAPKKFEAFKKKYGIGFHIENCVIDPMSFKRAVSNNQMILDYLNKKNGKKWQEELPSKPFGLK